ncbi:hypothetical protein LS73_006845 [Helicobacter muridarum]|uniref:ATP synthase subunit b n=1 Tax=Helicobacter muridarum TaxID=216 RepID=A0A099TZT3_9HELI|nr:hypothetical protein [Helicobacter muridarum]TLD99782.1 hypothetical protein LS73_006845 [Helicobacter muridarum]STQ86984.1 ATP synthase F0F1 subunit B' [Helicobacter muridarum]
MEIIPNPQVMLVVFIVFIITMFLLNKFVFEPIIYYIDQRNAKINSDLAIASQDDKELSEINKQINKILSEAKSEAYAIKSRAIQDAKDSANKKIEQAQLENREKMEEFLKELSDQKDKMRKDIKACLSDIDSTLLMKIKNV